MRFIVLSSIVAAGWALSPGAAAQQAPASPQQQQAQDQAQKAARQDDAVVKAAFKRADTDNDGRLSREEAAIMPAVAEKFSQLDKDGDGYLSAAEFEAGVTSQPPATAP